MGKKIKEKIAKKRKKNDPMMHLKKKFQMNLKISEIIHCQQMDHFREYAVHI